MAATFPPRTFKHGEYVNAVPLRPGGMATVFSATHVPSGDRVAIKRHDRGDPARFQREGRLICDPTLRSHRFSNHVVMGREVFSEGGADYLVMELVDGLPLSERPFHHLPLRKALLLVDSILNGIEYLHDSGCIHRDIKPQNLLYLPHASTPYFVKIVDLGIARYADGLVTATQFGMGTLTFTAPECFLYPYDSKETADLYR